MTLNCYTARRYAVLVFSLRHLLVLVTYVYLFLLSVVLCVYLCISKKISKKKLESKNVNGV